MTLCAEGKFFWLSIPGIVTNMVSLFLICDECLWLAFGSELLYVGILPQPFLFLPLPLS